jgi:hypothetical protein
MVKPRLLKSFEERPLRRALIAALVMAGVLGAASPASRARAQGPSVAVTREEPVIERREFDSSRPPANMPKLTAPESGVCDTTFQLSAGIGYSVEVVGPTSINLWVDKLDITTRQHINIFTVRGAPAKLRAHEEGHREISEHYYRNAVAVVRAAAAPLIGRKFTGNGASRAAAEKDAVNKVQAVLEGAYMLRTRMRSIAANERYDEITEHGLNLIDEADAIARVLGADNG